MNARAANPSDTTVDVWYPTGLPSPAGKGFPLVRWVCYRYRVSVALRSQRHQPAALAGL